MNKIISLFFLVLFISCNSSPQEKEYKTKEIRVESISSKMGCENCGMNLKKFISTSHALKMKNDDAHFYCSINCSSIAINSFGDSVKIVYGIDYGLSKYFPVEELNYVIDTKLKGTMTNISKFAFRDSAKAISFKDTFEGKSIVSYDQAYKMSLEEISLRR